jgi:hypothetical protein
MLRNIRRDNHYSRSIKPRDTELVEQKSEQQLGSSVSLYKHDNPQATKMNREKRFAFALQFRLAKIARNTSRPKWERSPLQRSWNKAQGLIFTLRLLRIRTTADSAHPAALKHHPRDESPTHPNPRGVLPCLILFHYSPRASV